MSLDVPLTFPPSPVNNPSWSPSLIVKDDQIFTHIVLLSEPNTQQDKSTYFESLSMCLSLLFLLIVYSENINPLLFSISSM